MPQPEPRPALVDVVATTPPEHADDPRGTQQRSGGTGWLDLIERELLGRTRQPLAERLSAAGWVPDQPSDYCPCCGGDVGAYEVHERPSGSGVSRTACSTCRERRLAWSRSVRLGAYEGELREALLEGKYWGWRRLEWDIGRLLGRALREALESANLSPQQCLAVPVPVSRRRLLTGGIDHTLALCRGIRHETGIRIVPAMTARAGPRQVEVSVTQRQRNVAGRFRVRSTRGLRRALLRCSIASGGTRADKGSVGVPNARPGGTDSGHAMVVLIVDDIRTTGATMSQACRTLWRGIPTELRPAVTAWSVTAAVTRPPTRQARGGDQTENDGTTKE